MTSSRPKHHFFLPIGGGLPVGRKGARPRRPRPHLYRAGTLPEPPRPGKRGFPRRPKRSGVIGRKTPALVASPGRPAGLEAALRRGDASRGGAFGWNSGVEEPARRRYIAAMSTLEDELDRE